MKDNAHQKSLLENENLLDEIANILAFEKFPQKREAELKQIFIHHGLNPEKFINHELVSLNFSGFHKLSQEMMRSCLIHLKKGLNFQEIIHGSEKIIQNPDPCKNHIVNRARAKVLKVIEAIETKHADHKPDQIIIELWREFSSEKKQKERNQINKKNNDERTKAKRILTEKMEIPELNIKPKMIRKVQLWKEQNEYCPGCLKKIPDNTILQGCDISHLVPRSISFDDSFQNIILMHGRCNQEMQNSFPYDFFKDKIDQIKQICKNLAQNEKKFSRLLMSQQDMKQKFKNRHATDTQYITKLLAKELRDRGHDVQIRNGTFTSEIRKRWGKPKKRTDDIHHAEDAIMLACTEQSMVQKLANYFKQKEDLERTGKIHDKNIKRPWFDLPWPSFKEDMNRIMEEFRKGDSKVVYRFHKKRINGDLHQDTIYSARFFEPTDPNSFLIRRINLWENYSGIGQKPKPEELKKTLEDLLIEASQKSPKNPKKCAYILRNKALYTRVIQRIEAYEDKKLNPFDFQDSDDHAFRMSEHPIYHKNGQIKENPIIRQIKIPHDSKSGILVRPKGMSPESRLAYIEIYQEIKSGNFYFSPIYRHQALRGLHPEKLCTAHKSEIFWPEIDPKKHKKILTLYPDEMIRIIRKSGEVNEGYFSRIDRAIATITLTQHSNIIKDEINKNSKKPEPKLVQKKLSITTGVQTIEKIKLSLTGDKPI